MVLKLHHLEFANSIGSYLILMTRGRPIRRRRFFAAAKSTMIRSLAKVRSYCASTPTTPSRKAPWQGVEKRQESLNPHELEHRDEQLVALPQRTDLFFERREKLPLKDEPVIR